MIYQNIISALGLIGLGAILKSIIDSLLKAKELQRQKQNDFKEVRYKAVILLMHGMLDFEKSRPEFEKHGRQFNTITDLLEEIKIERNNMILYASDKVILAITEFINQSTEENYFRVAFAMRKDLYGLNTRLLPSDLNM
ncbi:hypothetical protein [Chitinophaga filiformis]|uniref:Uncharacterized protein n=1 Tax=Chitinophaga filiformis TaxID=104663 RepID=A0ABY4IB33_CHIFI|nr:hypothetical protein [Chitinophaga filiformis]UPK72853.1 hypothetical protein MYF79_16300 [Chitinophaga filiformis]